MKIFTYISLLLFSSITFASFQKPLKGSDLKVSAEAAFTEASFEIDLNTITSWDATIKGHIIKVTILSSALKAPLVYGCHHHGPGIDCHEEDSHLSNTNNSLNSLTSVASDIDFNLLKVANETALKKLSKTLGRKELSLDALTTNKVWRLSESDNTSDEHEHGDDVWTKAIYKFNGEQQTVFVQCHQHEGEKEFACHYKLKGIGEPGTDNEKDHDHDHDNH